MNFLNMHAIDNYIKTKFKIKSEIRIEFFKRLIFIIIGVVFLLFFGESHDWDRYIALAAFIISMYQILIIVSKSKSIVDDFFPPKILQIDKTKKLSKSIYYFASSMFFGGIVFLLFEINTIDNTINGMDLFWISSLIGILVASVLTIVLKKVNPSIFYESNQRFNIYTGLFLGLFLLCPAIASFINHFNLNSQVEYQNFKIIDKAISSTRNKSYWLFLDMGDNNEERFEVTNKFYSEVSVGDEIVLGTKKGNLEYDLVIEYKIK